MLTVGELKQLGDIAERLETAAKKQAKAIEAAQKSVAELQEYLTQQIKELQKESYE